MSSSVKKSKKVFVANLSSRTKEKDLEEFFGTAGKVLNVTLRDGRNSDPIAFIEFDTVEEAQDAIDRIGGSKLHEKELRVEFARDNRREGGEGRGGDRSGPPPTGCYICKEKSHVAKDCPKGNGKIGACYLCGSRSHRMRDCPKGGRDGGRRRSRSRSRSRSNSSPRRRGGKSDNRDRDRDRRRRRSRSGDNDRKRRSPSSSNSRSGGRRRRSPSPRRSNS